MRVTFYIPASHCKWIEKYVYDINLTLKIVASNGTAYYEYTNIHFELSNVFMYHIFMKLNCKYKNVS